MGGVEGGEVDARPDVAVLPVLDAQPVEHVRRVQPRIVAKLPRYDLQGFGETFDDALLLEGDVSVCEPVQVRRELHLAGAAAGDDAVVPDGALDHHDGVVQAALDLCDELLGAAAEDEGASACAGAAPEEVVALGPNLHLVEGAAGAEVVGRDVAAGGLDGGAGGAANAVEVGGRDTPGAEDIAVCKVSCGFMLVSFTGLEGRGWRGRLRTALLNPQ